VSRQVKNDRVVQKKIYQLSNCWKSRTASNTLVCVYVLSRKIIHNVSSILSVYQNQTYGTLRMLLLTYLLTYLCE